MESASLNLLFLILSFFIIFLLQFGYGEDRIVSMKVAQQMLHRRSVRSIEGGNCTVSGSSDSCTAVLSYTRCDPARQICICDARVATKLPVMPGYAVCVPLSFPNNTNYGCIPSVPDMCNSQVSGSTCSPPVANSGTTKWNCKCTAGGTFPNCIARLGTPCMNNTVCTTHLNNSMCGQFNTTTGWGICRCPTAGDILDPSATLFGGSSSGTPATAPNTLIPSIDQTRCVPAFCPWITSSNPLTATTITPCNAAFNDPPIYSCYNTSTGYNCQCLFKGKSHNINTPGICCKSDQFVCSDYSKCLSFDMVCNGVADCGDCSDEKQAFCTGAWPSNPVCGPPNRIIIDEFGRMPNRADIPNLANILAAGISSQNNPEPFAFSNGLKNSETPK